ncbi:metallophosphoesterase, partial [Pectobacterium versatile]
QQVPDYYRSKEKSIKTWFLINEIECMDEYERKYDELFARNGNPTYIFISSKKKKNTQSEADIKRRELKANNILVLSDLHFGENFSFCYEHDLYKIGQTKTSLSTTIMRDLEKLDLTDKISLLLITGDFTTKGNWKQDNKSLIISELHSLCNKLGISHEKIIALPGNHDMVRFDSSKNETVKEQSISNQMDKRFETDFRLFVEELTGRHWHENLSYNAYFKFLELDINLDLTILNSCGIVTSEWSEYGYVGQEGIDAINSLPKNIDEKTYRILALHHHLLPVNNVELLNEKGISLTIDSLKVIKNAISKGITLALHGHQHIFNMAKYTLYERSGNSGEKPLTIISNGSTSVDQSRRMDGERNSYTLLNFGANGLRVIVREFIHSDHNGVTIMDKIIN